MHFKSRLFRLTVGLCLVFSMSVLAFADTIRLKDGSIIKGKIVTFGGGKFTVSIGEGTRKRDLTFTAEEIESITFDTAPAVIKSNVAVNTDKSTPPTITVGQNNQQVYTPPTTAPANNPRPAAASGKAIEVDVKVLADNTANGWTNSGWVVKKGQRIRIIGDGRVSLGNGRYATAAGISSLPDDEKLLKNVATGALIAVIGDDNNEFIYVGENNEFVAQRDGALFLGVNEGNLDDNSGAFDVKVEILIDGE